MRVRSRARSLSCVSHLDAHHGRPPRKDSVAMWRLRGRQLALVRDAEEGLCGLVEAPRKAAGTRARLTAASTNRDRILDIWWISLGICERVPVRFAMRMRYTRARSCSVVLKALHGGGYE